MDATNDLPSWSLIGFLGFVCAVALVGNVIAWYRVVCDEVRGHDGNGFRAAHHSSNSSDALSDSKVNE